MVGAAARSGCSSNEGSRVGAETVDAAAVDAVTVGAAALDAAMVDVAAVNAAIVNAAAVDVAAVNAATVDATTVGAATVNAATVDATMVDVATVDAAAEDRRQRRMQRIIIWSKDRIYFQEARKSIDCRGCRCGTATMGFRERVASGVSVDWIGDQVIAAQAGGVFSSDSLQAYLTRLCVHSQCTQLVWFASDDLVSTPFSPML